jgi:2-polyprenyl-3-methyl-5-hydroxy-6-metoxy-1,4-benzoquinol methylase
VRELGLRVIESLEEIAHRYHLQGDYPDMFIEGICQKFEIEWVSKFFGQNDKVLDLGFGDGLFLESFLNHEDFTILEAAPSLVQKANQKIHEAQSRVKIVETLFEEYEPNSKFDLVIASHVLEHVENPHLVLKKCRDWLRPGGNLVVIVPNRESFHRRLGLKMGLQNNLEDLSQRDHAVGHLRVYSREILESELTNSGFEIKEAKGFFLKTLSNAQMLHLSAEVIRGLCELSQDLPVEYGANIGIVAVNAQ